MAFQVKRGHVVIAAIVAACHASAPPVDATHDCVAASRASTGDCTATPLPDLTGAWIASGWIQPTPPLGQKFPSSRTVTFLAGYASSDGNTCLPTTDGTSYYSNGTVATAEHLGSGRSSESVICDAGSGLRLHSYTYVFGVPDPGTSDDFVGLMTRAN